MAIAFKGERTVAELNNNLGGFVKDSAFRIYDHGILSKGNVPVKHGDFVSWTGTQWKIEPSLEYATSADVEAVEEQIESIGSPLQWKGPATVTQLNTGITGIQPGWTYTLTDAGTLTDGSVDVDVGDEVAWTEDGEWFKLGGNSEIHDGGSKTEADLVEGVLSIASTNSVTKLTLTTAQTLTVLANEGVPNFALEIDNTGNSNDVTVAVKDSTGTTTLKASAAGGNKIDDGSYVQLTCAGGCWTMAVFS